MSKHIYILQNRHETNTPNNVIKKIYDMVIQQEAHDGSVYDNESDFIGEVTLQTPTYKEWVDKIHEVFPDLIINSQYYMLFKDSNVEQIMINYLLSKGVGDGLGITYDDAKDRLITSLPNFNGNTTIEYFNELKYFERITVITNQQFTRCTNLKEIDLSNITSSSGASQFTGCSSLQKVTLGNLTVIPQSCFQNCSTLEFVENTDNVTEIKQSAFYGCLYLETIDLSNVSILGNEAFRNCSLLTNINISNITSIAANVFRACPNLTLQNNILPYLTTVGNEAFSGTAITGFDAENCLTIGTSSFYGCAKMTTLNIPNCQSIPNSAFQNCSSLAIDLNLPNLTSIGDSAFRSSGIKSIISLGNITEIKNNAFNGCSSLVTCGNAFHNIKFIGNGVFSNCTSLQSVGSMHYLETISAAAFSGCKLLNEFEFNTTITSIGNDAFRDCSSLVINNLNLPNLTSLGSASFRSSKLKSITSLGNITSLSTETFYTCKELTTVENNALANIVSIGNLAFANCSQLTSVNLSQNVISIGDWTFNECASLIINDLNLPNLTTLGRSSFRKVKIKEISSLGSITTIGDETFRECSSLTKINNNALYNVTSLGATAFYNCSALTDIGEIANLEYIGATCFSGCTSLTTCIDFSHIKTLGRNSLDNTTNISAKRNSKGCIDMTSIERIEGYIWGNYAPASFTGYIDLGTHLTYINTQNYGTLNASLIIRNTVLPTLDSSGWSHLNVKNGYYVYVLDEKLDDWKTLCSGYPDKFKPISELPTELQ